MCFTLLPVNYFGNILNDLLQICVEDIFIIEGINFKSMMKHVIDTTDLLICK